MLFDNYLQRKSSQENKYYNSVIKRIKINKENTVYASYFRAKVKLYF